MTQFSKIPTEPHYVILTKETINIPGDARWRETGGGHGYGPEDVENIRYEAFSLDQMENLKKRVEQLVNKNETYQLLKVAPVQVITRLNLTFKEG